MKNCLKQLYEDAKNIKEKDPACRNVLEAIILYPGFHAIFFHRIAHFFYTKRLYSNINFTNSKTLNWN